MEKYYIEFVESNIEYDDIYKVCCYDSKTNHLIGTIDFEVLIEPEQFFSDFLETEEDYEYIFGDSNNIIYIDRIHVSELYRKKGVGTFMLTKFFEEVLPKYYSHIDYIVLYKSAYDIQNDMKAFFNTHVLKYFYEKFGFVSCELNEDYMIKTL